MAQITLRGNPFHTSGELPKVGTAAPAFTLVKTDLAETTLKDFAGRRVVLNIFPSLDTPTCATSVRKFNALCSSAPNTTVLCVSADLPFAAKRFCSTEGLETWFQLPVSGTGNSAAPTASLWWTAPCAVSWLVPSSSWTTRARSCIPSSFPRSPRSPITTRLWRC
jgi:hypothetical protein